MEFKKEYGMNFYCDECNFGCTAESVMKAHKEIRHPKIETSPSLPKKS